jgi:plasmid maintenance system antidote protein VapI
MAVLPQDEADALRERLRAYDLPVNATARTLGISDTSMQRFMSGRYDMPVALAKVLEAVMEFRDGRKGAD